MAKLNEFLQSKDNEESFSSLDSVFNPIKI